MSETNAPVRRGLEKTGVSLARLLPRTGGRKSQRAETPTVLKAFPHELCRRARRREACVYRRRRTGRSRHSGCPPKAFPRGPPERRGGSRPANHHVWCNAPSCRLASVDTDRPVWLPTRSRARLLISLRLFAPLPSHSESRGRRSASSGDLLPVLAGRGPCTCRTRLCRRGLQTARLLRWYTGLPRQAR